jgi:hypothetical protein
VEIFLKERNLRIPTFSGRVLLGLGVREAHLPETESERWGEVGVVMNWLRVSIELEVERMGVVVG